MLSYFIRPLLRLHFQDNLITPYHVFSQRRIRSIVIIASLAATLSPLSSSIYFPALDDIAKYLNISMQKANLTITAYLLVQGLAPCIWGPISDVTGRRAAFFGAITLAIAANFGLLLFRDFKILLVFRALLAGGSAATIAMSTGVIADLATTERKGGYISLNQNRKFTLPKNYKVLTSFPVRQGALSLGPILGGLLTETAGFRSIFAFMIGLSILYLLLILLFLPETQHDIAGNGTVELHGIEKPLIYCFRGQPHVTSHLKDLEHQPKLHWRAFTKPLRWLSDKDVLCLLFIGGAVYTAQQMVISSQSDTFHHHYRLNDFEVGLSFLPTGLGTIIGGQFKGWILDREMRAAHQEYRRKHGIPSGHLIKVADHPDFPLETARLRWMPYITSAFVCVTIAYGFSLSTDIAVPFLLQGLMGATSAAVLNINTTYMTDLFPSRSASAVALQNLVRCFMGAAGVAAVKPLLDAVGPGPTFCIAAGIVVVLSPTLVCSKKYGPRWRGNRIEKKREKMEEEVISGGEGSVRDDETIF